jgi:hypothetical protein
MAAVFKGNDYLPLKFASAEEKIKPEALKSLYRSPGNKKNRLVLCKNYVLQW